MREVDAKVMGRDAHIEQERLQGAQRRGLGRAPGEQSGQRRDECDLTAGSHPRAPSSTAPIIPHFARAANRAGAALLAAALVAGAAAADGVVVESRAGAYAVGDIVKAGDAVDLVDGETLVVLDQSGAIAVLDKSGAYDSEPSRARASIRTISAVDAAFWSGQRAEIGGVRTADLEACLEEAALRDELDEEDCRLAHAADPAAPALHVGLAMRAVALQPAAPLMLKLEASFDAVAVCTAAAAGDGAEAHPLELAAGDGALRLVANVPAMAPQRGSPRLKAPDAPGDYVVACHAAPPQTWTAYSAAVAPELRLTKEAAMLHDFAEMRGEPSASGAFTVRVTD